MSSKTWLTACFAFALVASCGSHPSDAELQEAFEERKQDLSQLIELLRADPTVECVWSTKYTVHSPTRQKSSEPSEIMSERRWDLYREHLRNAGVSRACNTSRYYPDGEFFAFTVSTGGNTFGATSKSYVFYSQDVVPLSRGVKSEYIPLGGGWYIAHYGANDIASPN